ncbi:M81 family metallopeptidase [Dyadobacter aurulentus]|uniref:M81 family metallopeptidase n=1 Tax=Dyadobacter sp. UC 10 TaxID=2605428 RepID=UPI0011F1E3B7|nr:M81 family metallopeptidase [Dyadobacter sp. UC 10]KAA0988815.1 M81 family metallopeptidase [Dyadobacter sp. UC 10]
MIQKRVALLGIYHETNTFAPELTDLGAFHHGFWLEQEQILDEYRGGHHEISGMAGVIEQVSELTLVPVFYAYATPGGMVTKEALDSMLSRMFALLDKSGPFDGILVAPHGAGVSELHPDMDGYWLQQLRLRVGPEMPIVGTLDPHANVSPLMASSTTALFPYQTNPHLDQAEVGRKAARLMVSILLEGKQYEQTLLQLPMAISIEQQNMAEPPCRGLLECAGQVRAAFNLQSVSLLLGFPYADVAEMGSAFLLIYEKGNTGIAQATAQLLAYVQPRLATFNGIKTAIYSLIPQLSELEKPVLLLDMGDNVGGGGSAASTHLLEAFDEARLSGMFICIYDPEAVKVLGQNPELPFSLRVGETGYRVSVVSSRMIDGHFSESTPKHGGFVNFDMGQSAIITTATGQTIMLTSLRTVPYSLEQLLSKGLRPVDFDYIVAKGVNAPIAAYQSVCKTICKIDTPGTTGADMTRFKFLHRRIPLFPFEYV